MRTNGYWHAEAPNPAAMASRVPFCADTLAFTEWLQFVFLPRLHRIVERDLALPQASGIAVMGEEALGETPKSQPLLAQLRAFDALVAAR